MAKILISGGSGLIGRALTQALEKNGHEVVWLSRNLKGLTGRKTFQIDINKNYIDEKAFDKTDVVINLAGAGIVDKAWTATYKKELLESRVKTASLLYHYLRKTKNNVSLFIGASAIGYYGSHQSDMQYDESANPGNDFMARVCSAWEESYRPIEALIPRSVVFRIGVVLSNNGGAYKKMRPVFQLGLGSPLASGRQYFPWIHVTDLCGVFLKAIESPNWHGCYNAVAPQIISNAQFSASLAKSLHKAYFMPAIPEVLLKTILGERHLTLTRGLKISSEKITQNGYEFVFNNINKALADLNTEVTK